nr:hypothetical protein [Nostoc flagelliforme]
MPRIRNWKDLNSFVLIKKQFISI